MVEQSRVEALGTAHRPGVGRNLAVILEDQYQRKGFESVTDRRDVAMSDVVRLLTREAFTGMPPPPAAAAAVDLWRPEIGAKIAEDLNSLRALLGDQQAFAKAARQLIDDLDVELGDDSMSDDNSDDSEGDDDSGDSDDSADSGTRGMSEDGDESEMTTAEMEAGDETMESDDISDMDMEPGGADDETTTPGAPPSPPPMAGDGRNDKGYRPFTSEFDEVVAAADLCDSDELSRLRGLLDQQIAHLQGVIAKLANRLQRRLMAKQNRSWEFDLDEGILDAGRLSRVVTTPLQP
ncbi:MAG: cobaltochelatase subunit CobT, partial [Pseudomonadota bacterium]|nr:cobaltochelatase subunit CobT [Pseudomonadota bacterium]